MPYNNLISRTDAAALIPEEVSNALRTRLMHESAALNLFTRVPVGRAQVRLPVLSALPIAYFVSGDTGLKQTTEVNWANKFLNIEEIACIVPIPDSVLDDVDQPIWGEVQPLVEQAVGRTLDAAVFFGTNAPGTWPTNVVAAAVAAGNVFARGTNNAAAGGLAEDINDLLATLEADGYDANGALANRTYRGFLRGARNSQGNQLPEVSATQAYGVDITYPMRGLWPTGLSAAELIALDRAEFVIGVRQDITWKLLDQAVIQDGSGVIQYNLAQQDMVAMRVVFRVGWQVANTINYDQATEANRYPAAVLRSPAA
jgi:HK97 family phage major capsid protein